MAPAHRGRVRVRPPASEPASAARPHRPWPPRPPRRHLTCSGTHAASLRFAEQVPFTSIHALEPMAWPDIEWPVAHCAAIARQAAKAGEPSPSSPSSPRSPAVCRHRHHRA